MSQKRDRRSIITVLILVFIAVGGFLLFPLLSGAIKQEQVPVPKTAASTEASTAAKQDELKALSRGYEEVLQRTPDDRTALKGLLEVRLEMVRQKMTDFSQAIEPLEKLAKLNPDNTEYGILLAQAKQHDNDLEGAATVYRSILESKPGDLLALEGLVKLLLDQKRPEAAIGVLQEKLDAAPKLNQIQSGTVDEISVRLLLASVYAEQQRYDEAIALYNEAIEANKDDFRPVWGKGVVVQLQGKIEEAKELFTTATNLAPAKYKDQIKARIKQLEAQTAPVQSSPSNSP